MVVLPSVASFAPSSLLLGVCKVSEARTYVPSSMVPPVAFGGAAAEPTRSTSSPCWTTALHGSVLLAAGGAAVVSGARGASGCPHAKRVTNPTAPSERRTRMRRQSPGWRVAASPAGCAPPAEPSRLVAKDACRAKDSASRLDSLLDPCRLGPQFQRRPDDARNCGLRRWAGIGDKPRAANLALLCDQSRALRRRVP